MNSKSSCMAARTAFVIPALWNLQSLCRSQPSVGEYLHVSIHIMAAAYLFHITQNHPFIDGNKRAGANAAITFLLMNDWEPTFTEEQLVDLVLGVAQGVVGKDRIAKFFEECTRPAE